MLEYSLTKTKIKAGLTCHKRLWFDINDRIKPNNHTLYIGNRFGEFIKTFYGAGIDLYENFSDGIINLTIEAMNDPLINVIYEGAFIYANTLIRADVLTRDGNKWKLIEVKSSTSLQDDHLKDAAIQAFVISNSNILISEVKIAHINNKFIYEGNQSYEDLVIEINVDEQIADLMPKVQGWINELLPITEKSSMIPEVKMGEQCKDTKKRECIYFRRCESQTILGKVEVPIKILPRIGNALQSAWFAKGVYDLRKLPETELKNEQHLRIQRCHQFNSEWIDPNLLDQIRNFEWPRFFIDFETIQQGVPLIINTQPYEAYPFQFSVHKWESEDQTLMLEDSQSFLEFAEDGMDRRFLLKLIGILGDKGPIFTHNSPTEITAMKRLAERENCRDLLSAVNQIISRTIDTATMIRQGFYNPLMMGSFSLKDIVKVLPEASGYSNEGESIGDGGSAMIKWLEYTNQNTDQAKKENIKAELKKYCAQDTLNLYHLFRYILSKNPT